MTYCIQETDSQPVCHLSFNSSLYSDQYQLNETTSGTMKTDFVTPSTPASRVSSARRFIYENVDIDKTKEAKSLLSVIRDVEFMYLQAGIDLMFLPQLEAFTADDGSILFEWIFDDFRVGFSIELNSENSGWFLVTNKHLGEINASGFIAEIDQKALIFWLLDFIITRA